MVKSMLVSVSKAIRLRLIQRASRSERFSSVYYAIFSRAFAREHLAVLQGQLKHVAESHVPQKNRYRLIRNIHRLEKGLLMRPRRDIFGLAYIAETLECYRTAVTNVQNGDMFADSSSLQWAHDVLSVYFEHVSLPSDMSNLEEIFYDLPNPSELEDPPRVPHKIDRSIPLAVDYDDLKELARQRKSVRWYQPIAVSRDLIDRAIAIASMAPSACNRQPYSFRVFDEPELVRRVAEIPMGSRGYSDNIPMIVAVIGELRAFFSERDRHLIYIDASLASMLFILALETLGLASCCINWPDIRDKEDELTDLLQLEPDQRVIMLIALGYPDPEGLVACSQRLSLDSLRRYNLQ